jgi:hypothetical protein
MQQTIEREEKGEQAVAEAGPDRERPFLPHHDEWLVLGRPVEDRSFEAVETGMGLVAGLAIGSAVAGPVGAAVGGIIGAAAGLAAGEAVERAAGRAATTTDVEDD